MNDFFNSKIWSEVISAEWMGTNVELDIEECTESPIKSFGIMGYWYYPARILAESQTGLLLF